MPRLEQTKQYPTLRKQERHSHNQRDQLLAFADILDQKLAAISPSFELPLQVMSQGCLLYRKQPTSNAYWEQWNWLHSKLFTKFYGLMKAVSESSQRDPDG